MTVKLEMFIANVPEVQIADALTHHLDGFHMESGVGYWQGVGEMSTHVTVVGNFDQQAVLATVTELATRVHDEDSILYVVTNEHGLFARTATYEPDGRVRTEPV